MDKQSVTDRINILFIGILTVVAYYFVIQDNVPEISYLTLIDLFVILTFLILAASVIMTLIIGKLDQAGKVQLGNKIDRICRWAFPLSYTAPRQGRYSKIAIAILIYGLYANILATIRGMLEREELSPWIGMWWVHIALIALSVWLLRKYYGKPS